MEPPPHRLPILVGRGPRDTEARLFARLDELAAEAELRPELLARPVRVVVPSGALADHLAAGWLRHRGRAAAGVRCETLFALAAEVLERAGTRTARGGLAFELLVRRAAAAERRLSAGLSSFADGLGAVSGSVRDLLDAGLTEAHLAAVDERLEAQPARGAAARGAGERAREIARVAARCRRELDALGALRTSDRYALAAERLASSPELLPARHILIHGYANATGLALDLLEVLVARLGAELLLDLPPDPAQNAMGQGMESRGAPAGLPFASRLALRLAGWSEPRLARAAEDVPAAGLDPAALPSAPIRLLAAPGRYAEVQGVAERIRALLAAGVRPESVAVVARDLAPYRLPLRQVFDQLAVPFSARSAAGSPGATERRLAALLDLVRLGGRAPVDRWLTAIDGFAGAGRFALDLRLGFRSLGAVRLDDAARLDPRAVLIDGALPLPIAGQGEEDGAEPSSRRRARRRLEGAVLSAAVAAAAALVRHLGTLPARTPLAQQLAWLERLWRELLGWLPTEPGRQRAQAALARLAADLPANFSLSIEELGQALSQALDDAAELPLGGRGGGVAVLAVTEARGLTFEHLFLLGLSRDAFPRKIVEDPLLPDGLRRALTDLLPDLPIKSEGYEEERYLFAQLLSSAGSVVLSYPRTDDDGEPVSLSPLVERLRLAGCSLAVEVLPHLYETASPGLAAIGSMPVARRALLLALAGGREALMPALPAVLAAAGQPPGLALFRRRLLDEIDPDLGTPEGRATGARLGPFFGLVGPGAARGALYVTELERLAACGWKATLERTLRLAPAPDPMSALATLDGLLVGEVVHGVVERWARAAGALVDAPLAEALAQAPVAALWPERAELERWSLREAQRVAREHGVPLLARPLAVRSLALLGAAARAGLGAQGTRLYGAELEGSLPLAAGVATDARTLGFRADLAEVLADEQAGGLALTDLKVSAPPFEQKSAERRQARLLADVASGKRLQAAAYALAADVSRGRYLFVGKPAEDGLPRWAELAATDETRHAFEAVLRPLLAARDAGAFTPRLLDAKLEQDGPSCRYCRVLEACVQRDSGATRRLARWLAAKRRDGLAGESELAARAFDLLELAVAEPAAGEGT